MDKIAALMIDAVEHPSHAKQRIAELEAEVERLREPGPPELTWGMHNALVLRIGALNTQNERLREAVQSAIETWDDNSPGRGLTERQALAKLRASLEPRP